MSSNPQSTLKSIPLKWIVLSASESQIQRRMRFAKSDIDELAESLKVHGLINPILVRRNPLKGDDGAPDRMFELVAGERRFLAAQAAGLQSIDATVRDLTEEQVLEIQLIENLQRVDLHPLQEAEGYEQLMKQHRHKADELGDKIGKSKAYVYARLKLLALCKEARAAFYDGTLSNSTALLIARIPNDGLQKQALKEITTRSYGDDPVMSVRQASRHIHDNYMLKLSSSGFKTEDATLVPAAGACGACPKRTGNQPELFGDVKGADVCTDPACFKAKVTAHTARAKTDAEARGQKVITGSEAKKIAPYGADSSLQGFVRLDAHDYSDNKNRTYRQILGKSFEPVLLQDPSSGKLVEVAPTSAVKKASPARSLNPQYAQEKKAKLEGAYRAELFKQVRAASMARSAKLLRTELEEAAIRMFERLDSDTTRRLAKVLEWPSTELPTEVSEMTDPQLAQFIRDCTLASDLYAPTWSNSKPQLLEDAAADLKIDTKKIRLQVADQKKPAAATAKGKSKPKAKKGAKR